MKKFVETGCTAVVTGAQYVAEVLAKLHAFRKREANESTPAAVVAGTEYRATSSQRQWMGLLTWPDAK